MNNNLKKSQGAIQLSSYEKTLLDRVLMSPPLIMEQEAAKWHGSLIRIKHSITVRLMQQHVLQVNPKIKVVSGEERKLPDAVSFMAYVNSYRILMIVKH